MSETQIALPRVAKGKRPMVFEDPAVDHLMAMVLELSTELAAVYQRLDTVERVLEEDGALLREKLDTYVADEAAEAERTAWRELFLERLFRTIREDRG